MEIDKDAFGDFLLMIPTSWLESKERFPHFPTGPTAIHQSGRFGLQTKRCLPDPRQRRRRNLSGTSLPLAGFQVIIIGRFWVITEGAGSQEGLDLAVLL